MTTFTPEQIAALEVAASADESTIKIWKGSNVTRAYVSRAGEQIGYIEIKNNGEITSSHKSGANLRKNIIARIREAV
jgi:hypothetical protein